MVSRRKALPHGIPPWVGEGAEYFITFCTIPRGKNQLCNPVVSHALHDAFAFYQNREDLWIHLLLIMPDHLHAIMSFNRCIGMKKSIGEYKKYTARKLGIEWQRDFFDHRLRAGESYAEKAHYIRMNPVRAGLCISPKEWPYVWEYGPW